MPDKNRTSETTRSADSVTTATAKSVAVESEDESDRASLVSESESDISDPDPDMTEAILSDLLGKLDVSEGPSGSELLDFEACTIEEEWQPAEPLHVWVDRVWLQLPHTLREWCVRVEKQDPNRKGQNILPTLRERVTSVEPAARREAVRAALEAEGVECAYMLSSMEALQSVFPADFGRTEFTWDEDTSDLEWVLSVADCFITLCQPVTLHSCLNWTVKTIVEPPGESWQSGGVHREWKQWAELPGCSERVKKWVKDRVWVAPISPVPVIHKQNAACLRPGHKKFDKDRFEFVDEKVKSDFEANVLRKLHSQPTVVSPLNAVPKYNSKDPFRVISNMRELNKYFPGWSMKFDDIRMVKFMFRQNFFIWSLDQHAAYHTILAHPRLAQFFGIQWQGEFFGFNSLPFGFRLSPYFFCKCVRQLVKHWRRAGIAIQTFVDDQAGGNGSFFMAILERNRVLHDNIAHGFSMSHKSDPLPFQRRKFLGFILHLACPTPRMHTPIEKVVMLKEAARLVATTGDFPDNPAELVPPRVAHASVECSHGTNGTDETHAAVTDEYSSETLMSLIEKAEWPENPFMLDLCAGVSCGGQALAAIVPRLKVFAFEIEPEHLFRDRMHATQDVRDRIIFRIGDLSDLTLAALLTLISSHGHVLSDLVCIVYIPHLVEPTVGT